MFERVDRPKCSMRIRSFRVVEETHSTSFADELHAVREGRVVGQRLDDSRMGGTYSSCCCRGAQRVGDVVG